MHIVSNLYLEDQESVTFRDDKICIDFFPFSIYYICIATVVRDKYSVRGHRRRSTLKIAYPDIKSIICFVPVVNSATEWRTVSLPVVIASNGT